MGKKKRTVKALATILMLSILATQVQVSAQNLESETPIITEETEVLEELDEEKSVQQPLDEGSMNAVEEAEPENDAESVQEQEKKLGDELAEGNEPAEDGDATKEEKLVEDDIQAGNAMEDSLVEVEEQQNMIAQQTLLTTLEDNTVYRIYNVLDTGSGLQVTNRAIYDNGAQASKDGGITTSAVDASPTNEVYSRTAWRAVPVEGQPGQYYIQSGFSHGWMANTMKTNGRVALVTEGNRQAYQINIVKTDTGGRVFVSIQSVSNSAGGTASYLQPENTNTSGSININFATVVNESSGTLWCIEEAPKTTTVTGAEHLWRPPVGNLYYRIPALATANNGDVIAITDLRYNNSSDLGGGHEIDLLRKIRPYDSTAKSYGTWGEAYNLTIANRGSGVGYGDAAIVADRDSDQVLVLAANGSEGYGGNNRASSILSTDGGVSFDAPIDLADQIRTKIPDVSFFFASGKIMQSRYVKVGNYYRLYSAVLACPVRNTGAGRNWVLYSDDFGKNWEVLGGTATAPIPSGGTRIADEAKIEELPNGDVVINARNANNAGRHVNVFSYTTKMNGTKDYSSGTWDTPTKISFEGGDLKSQGTNGELMTIYAKKSDGTYTHLLLHSLPSKQTGNNGGRTHVTVWYRETDERDITASQLAIAWKKGLLIQEGASAYSTMTIQADGTIGFFYEDSVSWYDMVYTSLSVDAITGGRGEYAPAFLGIGSKLRPYLVDDAEKAAAYRDVFGLEKVNWEFTDAALEKLAADYNETASSHPEGEMLAVAWKYLRDSQGSISFHNNVTKEELVNALEKKAQEKDPRITVAAQSNMTLVKATGGKDGSATITVSLTCDNTTCTWTAQVPVVLSEKEKIEQAIKTADAVLSGITAANEIKKEEVQKAVQEMVDKALGSNQVIVSWDSFSLVSATAQKEGSITSVLAFRCGSEQGRQIWNRVIPKLEDIGQEGGEERLEVPRVEPDETGNYPAVEKEVEDSAKKRYKLSIETISNVDRAAAEKALSENVAVKVAFESKQTVFLDISIKDIRNGQKVQPQGSVTFILGYPKGATRNSELTLLHMKNGIDPELLVEGQSFVKQEDGIRVTVNSFSPFIIGWKDAAGAGTTIPAQGGAAGTTTPSQGGTTADNVLSFVNPYVIYPTAASAELIKSPKTGEDTSVAAVPMLLLGCMGVLAYYGYARKREKEI